LRREIVGTDKVRDRATVALDRNRSMRARFEQLTESVLGGGGVENLHGDILADLAKIGPDIKPGRPTLPIGPQPG